VSDPQVHVDPEPPAPPELRARLSRVELAGAALAVAGGCVITLAVLTARGEPVGDATIAVSAEAARSQLAAGTAMTRDAGPGWTANRARWVANAPRSFAFEVPSHNRVAIWMREVRPLLVVRCLPETTDVFVFTQSAAMIEAQTEDHTVVFSFDDEPETRELWPDAAEHDALFAPDGAAFAKRLLNANSMRFGFTPHNAAPVTAHFQVSGLRNLVEPAAKGCGTRN
jgi:hypothetical protein